MQDLYQSRAIDVPPAVNMPAAGFVEALDYYLDPEGLEGGRRGGSLFLATRGESDREANASSEAGF